MNDFIKINTENIFPHPENPRGDEGDVSELAASIKARGVLQNITVVPRSAAEPSAACEGEYTVIMGHRRLKAAKEAGLGELLCRVCEMDRRTQIETMLLENIQRCDLTLFEQAQGFKSLFEMGVSVKDISQKTGFAETTVRRRIKAAELDADRFKKVSAERQIKMEELDKLSKIEDIDERNKLIDTLGTNNFQWSFNNAYEKQELKKQREPLLKRIEGMYEPMKERDRYSSKFVLIITYAVGCDPEEVAKTLNKGERKFVFVGYRTVEIYEKQKKTTEEKKADEAEIRRRKRLVALKELEQRALETRDEYIKEYHAFNKQQQAVCFVIKALLVDGYRSEFPGAVRDLFGFEQLPSTYAMLTQEEKARILACGANDALINLAYAQAKMIARRAHDQYSGAYSVNSAVNLKMLYSAMEEIGYRPSDEEQAYVDGTHEAYQI